MFNVLDLEGVASSLVEDDGVLALVIDSLVDGVQELLALAVFLPIGV